MAALLSRRCLSTLGLQQGSSFALAGPSRLAVRGYAAAATATKQKPKSATSTPAAAKPAIKTKPVSSATTPKKPAPVKSEAAPPPTPKVAAKKPAAKPTQATSTETVTKPERSKFIRANGRVMIKSPEKNVKDMSEQEQLAQLERAIAMSAFNPTRDMWGQSVETFDVILPYSTSISNRSNYSSWREMFEQFKENRRNAMKNYMSMATLAWDNAIPGIDLSKHRWWHKFILQWPWRLATTTSVSEGSWLTHLRKSALDSYCQLNIALAKGDDHTLKELTAHTYRDQVLRLRKKQKRDQKYIWHFHKEVTPARVLSIRATPGFLANEPPKFGNRNLVHALVRIDTEQSLEIYTHQGIPMHTPAAKRVKGGSAAEPVRVTEYFVFEKRMWYDGPWIIREQLWEVPGRKVAI